MLNRRRGNKPPALLPVWNLYTWQAKLHSERGGFIAWNTTSTWVLLTTREGTWKRIKYTHVQTYSCPRVKVFVSFQEQMLSVVITSDEWMFFQWQSRNLHPVRSSVHLQTALGKLAEMKRKELENVGFMKETFAWVVFLHMREERCGYNGSP